MTADVRQAAGRAGNSRALTSLARAGFAASGIVHLLLGVVAIGVAFHRAGQTDQSGALSQLTTVPGGTVVLWFTVVAFAALGLWLLIQALLGIGSSSKKRWVRSLVSAGKAVAYLALAATALSFANGGGRSGDSKGSSTKASADILALPGGPVLLTTVGLAAAGIGVYLIAKGLRQRFRDDIAIPSGSAERPVVVLGIVGYVAKGIAVVVVGILFVVAAVTADAARGSGLDGALKSLAALPFGQAVLTAVGLGLIAYGVYSFARARLARL
jgi:hypothetical protein